MFVCLTALTLCGCASSFGLVQFQNDRLINPGIYETTNLGSPWRPLLLLGGRINPEFAIESLDDIVYFRCPEEQRISISQARYTVVDRKGRSPFVRTAAEIFQYFSEDFVQLMTKMGAQPEGQWEIVTIQGHKAARIDLAQLNDSSLCRQPIQPTDLSPVRTRVVAVYIPKSLRYANFIILQYTSPTTNFDASVGDFERLIDSVRF